MNTKKQNPSDSRPSTRTRWSCRVVRQWSALTERRNHRHVDACPDCQAYFRATASIDATLRHDATAPSLAPVTTSDFERRILHAVRESAAEAEAERAQPWAGVWRTGGLVAAGALAIALVFINRDPAETPTSEIASSSPTEDAAVLVDAVESLSSRFTRSVIPSAGVMVAENPLQQELGSVYADARSALDFLALNFLPSSSVRAANPPGRTI